MKRFHWTRRKYQHAHSLNRMLNRWYAMPSEPPAIVRRYLELWDQHRSDGDPLLLPLRYRYDRDDDVPF